MLPEGPIFAPWAPPGAAARHAPELAIRPFKARTRPQPRRLCLDTDLSESLTALREAFEKRKLPHTFQKGDEELISVLRNRLRLPRRYREFLLAANPRDCEVKSPAESIRLLPAESLLEEQNGYALEGGELITETRKNGWKKSWIIIAHSTMLGDPYFLDVALLDAEGDCPVYSAMSGTEPWQPRLCASNFVTFLGILALAVDIGRGFNLDSGDYEDEEVFRETLAPRLKQLDPAAHKAGHWT